MRPGGSLSRNVRQVVVFIVRFMVFPHHKDNLQPFRGQSAQGFIMGVPLRPLVGSGGRDTLNRLIEALPKAIGPVAPQIVREHIAVLCESRYAFPESRIRELMALPNAK
jgi:hypothetical protein